MSSNALAGPSTLQPSRHAIRSFLLDLPHSSLTSASPTHLPTTFPLAFPSPLHTLNFLSTLHCDHLIISHSSHARYFAETRTSPRETAIRGVLGLFLASDEAWSPTNLLSAESWRSGSLNEQKVAEFFGVQLVREKQHETISAIRVGERWDPAVKVVDALVQFFRASGDLLDKKGRSCLGEGVKDLLTKTFGEGDRDLVRFTKLLVEEVLGKHESFLTELDVKADGALPPATLRLLQDLAYRQHTSSDLGLDLPLPDPAELANMTALPLSIPVLLQLGILALPDDQSSSAMSTRSDSTSGPATSERLAFPLPRQDFELLALAGSSAEQARQRKKENDQVQPVLIELPSSEISALQTASVRACEEVRRAASENDTEQSGGDTGAEGGRKSELEQWKRDLTFLDICRVFERLEEVMVDNGLDVRLVPV